MPIDRLLQNSKLEPAAQKALRLAFIRALRLLGLVDRNDPVCEIVACKIMEIGATGVSDPIAISDIAVRQLSAFIALEKKPLRAARQPHRSLTSSPTIPGRSEYAVGDSKAKKPQPGGMGWGRVECETALHTSKCAARQFPQKQVVPRDFRNHAEASGIDSSLSGLSRKPNPGRQPRVGLAAPVNGAPIWAGAVLRRNYPPICRGLDGGSRPPIARTVVRPRELRSAGLCF
jgi:hypothetical protein